MADQQLPNHIDIFLNMNWQSYYLLERIYPLKVLCNKLILGQ